MEKPIKQCKVFMSLPPEFTSQLPIIAVLGKRLGHCRRDTQLFSNLTLFTESVSFYFSFYNLHFQAHNVNSPLVFLLRNAFSLTSIYKLLHVLIVCLPYY